MRFTRSNVTLMFIALALGLIAQILMVRSQNLGAENALNVQVAKVEQDIQQAGKVISSTKAEIFKLASINETEATIFARFAKYHQFVNPLDFYVFKWGKPVYWSSQNYPVNPNGNDSVSIESMGDQSVAIWKFRKGAIVVAYVLPIAKEKFASFSDEADPNNAFRENEFKVSQNSVENSMPVVTTQLPLFYLVSTHQHPEWIWDLVFLVAMAILVVALNQTIRTTSGFVIVKSLVVLIYVSIIWLFFQGETLFSIKAMPLFGSELYHSNHWWNSSLGMLLVLSLLGLFFGINFNRAYDQFQIKVTAKWLVWLVITLLFQTSYAILYGLLDNIRSLVVKGDITFLFHQFHHVTIYSVVGVAIIAIQFIAFFYIYDLAWSYLKPMKKWVMRNLSIMQLFIAAAWLFQGNYDGAITLAWTLFSVIWMLGEWFLFGKKSWMPVVLKVLVPCLVVSILLQLYTTEKEQNTRKELAQEILMGGDNDALFKIARLEWLLTIDKGVVDYYTCTDESKAEFEKRLRGLYFNELSGLFEVQILDYNVQGRNYRGENAYDFGVLNNLYKSDECIPVTAVFSRVNDLKLKGSYLGKFDVKDSTQQYGTYFVVLTPRISATEGRLSQIVNNDKLRRLYNDNQYSFGIYVNHRLSRTYGSFDYPVSMWLKPGFVEDSENGISHYVLRDSSQNTIILSRSYTGFLAGMSGFTLMALAGIVLVLVYYLVLWIQHEFIRITGDSKRNNQLLQALRRKLPFDSGADLYISSRLQLYVTWIVFATFLVVLVVTVNYFIQSYTRDQVTNLREKTNKIAQMLTSKVNINAVFERNNTALMYDLSDYYNTDINLYKADGTLYATTNNQLVENKFRANLMNPEVYEILQTKGSSAAVVNETLGDLNYLSTYVALFDKNLNVKGYLNLPYFSNRRDLFRDISDYTVTILNLFALVFALAIIVAYVLAQRIALPLNLIRKQMSMVRIGERNQPLSWDKNDEIGLLVTEYNKMLLELDASLNRLAEGERQGAWREMAKQVAHEIKNPLTPMRLSLQHLQYSLQRNDDNLKEKIQKTSELLIRQIDALSEMAEEFSSFAKMPEPQMMRVDLTKALHDAVVLMGKENGTIVDFVEPSEPIWVEADANMLGRIFNNVLKNAVQAIPEDRDGKIAVRVVCDTDLVNVYISDNGKGIPEELRERIFSPNFSTKNSGMGLGLAMVKKIVEQFAGKITFETVMNEGTTFEIQLPILK